MLSTYLPKSTSFVPAGTDLAVKLLNDAPTLTFRNGGITSQLPDNPLSDLPDAEKEMAAVSESQ
jgi:hypothetical protein